jgi:hypothetical protein
LIAAFIEKETGQADETTAAVAAVLRSELLIPASITDVTSGFGMEAKFADFAEKDSVIRKVRAQNLAEALAHGIPESFGNLRTLTSIVTDQPALLLPENDDFRRHITPLGSNLEQVFPIGKDQQTLLRDIANAPRRFFPKDSRAASEIMFKRLQAMFANCDQIIRDDFRNAKTHFPQESDVRLQLVEGSRSDAFLQGDVYDFIDYMRTVLDEEDGLYISDGVVGAYSYRLYYKELNKFLEALPSDMAVDFYIRDEEPKETPPVYLAGIRVYPKANAERVNDIKARKGYQVIDLGQLRENSMALKQMAWTFLYDQVIDYNHRQSFDYIDIDSIPANLIDELVSEIEKKYGPLLFSNFEDAEFLESVRNFIEKNAIPEIRRSRSALIRI